MKIKTTTPVKALLAQLPEGTITYIDLRSLSALNECIKALRTEHEGQEAPRMFTTDVRHAFALSINEALAQLIQTHIPRNPVGRPRAAGPTLAQEADERRAAKAQLEDERKELQAMKRGALEMREALEAFEKRAAAAAGAEPVGMPVDSEARARRLNTALDPVWTALDALQNTPCEHERLQALNASCTNWCNATNVLTAGKAAGVHKGKALADWLEACKKLGRDIAEELRNLK